MGWQILQRESDSYVMLNTDDELESPLRDLLRVSWISTRCWLTCEVLEVLLLSLARQLCGSLSSPESLTLEKLLLRERHANRRRVRSRILLGRKPVMVTAIASMICIKILRSSSSDQPRWLLLSPTSSRLGRYGLQIPPYTIYQSFETLQVNAGTSLLEAELPHIYQLYVGSWYQPQIPLNHALR